MRCSRRLDPFGAPDMDDEIDIAPVDAEIERRGADHGAQLSRRHRRFDLAPLADIERAVMQRDRQASSLAVHRALEEHLRLPARIDEDQRHCALLDRGIDFGDRIARGMAGPRHALGRFEDADVGRGTRLCPAPGGASSARSCALRRKPGAQRIGIGNGGGKANAPCLRRQALHARQGSDSSTPRFEVTSECSSSRTIGAEILQHMRGARIGNEQRNLFRRGDQDVAAASRAGACARECGVSPVRVSIDDGKAHLARPAFRDCARYRRPAP